MDQRIEYLRRCEVMGRQHLLDITTEDVILSTNHDSLSSSLEKISRTYKEYKDTLDQLLNDLASLHKTPEADELYGETRHLLEVRVPSVVKQLKAKLHDYEQLDQLAYDTFSQRTNKDILNASQGPAVGIVDKVSTLTA